MMLDRLYGRLFPDDQPEAVRRWRVFVSQVIFLLVAHASIVTSAMTIGLPFAGTLVWAEDIKTKVEESTKPATQQLTELSVRVTGLERSVQGQTDSLNRMLAQAKAAEIRTQTLKRCTAVTSMERDSYNREIDQLQFEYRALTGERYDTPRCSEL